MAHVRITNLGIKFDLADRQERSIRELLLHPLRRTTSKEFWAIRHVDVELQDGDVIGITGPNGCGKSTLLRSITGIYQPDEGTIETEGRVSLLAIGAGFNKELSGVENIFLNGAVFGFTQAQIEAMVPSIQGFADIGDFMFQPIRTYSSGMISRLGFAIAINLNPDILLIDEVMAVGDAAFKEKCVKAVDNLLARQDRIVAIVSHDADTIKRLCNRRLDLTRKPTPA